MTAKNLSSTELLVEWDPLPAKFIHGVLLGYSINLTRDETNFTKIASIPPSATSHRITGLKKYTRYIINMAAVNEVGKGVSSDDVIVWTEEDGESFLTREYAHAHERIIAIVGFSLSRLVGRSVGWLVGWFSC